MAKRTAALALTLAALASPAAGQDIPWANKFFQPTDPPAVIAHDFGTVPRGNLLKHSFPVRNIYKVPMRVVTPVRVSCGCVEAEPSPPVLASEGAGTLEVTMDARKFTGQKTVSMYVTFESINEPKYLSTAVLQVLANARTDVTIEPGIVQLGAVARGKERTEAVRVSYAGRLDWQLLGRADSCDRFEVRLQEIYRQPGRSAYNVYVTLKKDAPAGRLNEELVLRTNDPESPLLRVHVTGAVQGPVEVRTPELKLGGVPVGGSAFRYVMLQGSRPFRVTGVEGAGGGVEAELPADSKPIQIVKVTFSPEQPGAVRRELKFRTDADPDGYSVVLVQGEAIGD